MAFSLFILLRLASHQVFRTCVPLISSQIYTTIHYTDMIWTIQAIHLSINYFATAGLNDIVFAAYLPSDPGHLVPCTLDNADTISLSLTLNMILTGAILLLVRFLNFVCLFYVYLYVLRYLISHPQHCKRTFRVVNMHACHVYFII